MANTKKRKPKEKSYSKEDLINIIKRLREVISTKDYTNNDIVNGLEQCEELLRNHTN